MTVDGLLLAGGMGRRMGRPKADVAFAGTTLAGWTLDLLEARCHRVLVVSRPEVPLPPLPAPVVHDRPGPDAPLTGLATGLAELVAPRVAVLACDLPLAGPLLDRLLAHPGEDAAAGADPGGRVQPLCAVYPRERALAAAEALLAAGRVALTPLPAALGAVPVAATADELLNVNTPAELARARALLGWPGG